jgi:hypothetical protein
LPGTTGNNPQAIEKALGDPGDSTLLVELAELEDMVEVLLADYNGEPHSGISNRTPLEAMTQLLTRDQGYLRTLPRVVRQNLCLLQEARIVPIKGNINSGVRPHVGFLEVRYTSDILSSSPALIGKKLRIYFDVRDIRSVKAFFEDGAEARRPERRKTMVLHAAFASCAAGDFPLETQGQAELSGWR